MTWRREILQTLGHSAPWCIRESSDPRSSTYSVDQDDQVVSLIVTAGIVSHGVVVAEKGPVDGVNGERQIGRVLYWSSLQGG